MRRRPFLRSLWLLILFALRSSAADAASGTATQIFVTSIGSLNSNPGKVGSYGLDGTPINPTLISGLKNPQGITASDGKLFVTETGTSDTPGEVGVYTTSGAPINASLISHLQEPSRVAISGQNLFLTSSHGGIGEYTTSGAVVNASLISFSGYPVFPAIAGDDLFVSEMTLNRISKFKTSGSVVNLSFASVNGLNGAGGLVVSEGKLYVASRNGTIGEYDAATGATLNASLVSGLSFPVGLTLFDNHLFVVNYGTVSSFDPFKGYVGEYNLDGTPVNPKLITGLTNPIDIVLANVPEPTCIGWLMALLYCLLVRDHTMERLKERLKGT